MAYVKTVGHIEIEAQRWMDRFAVCLVAIEPFLAER